MADFDLQPNEAVLLKAENVMRGPIRFGASHTDDLILTNVHLICVSKGLFRGVKGVDYFPLSHVKVFNEQAQALMANAKNGRPSLEVYFQEGHEMFQFLTQTNSGAKKETTKWVDAINAAVTGAPAVSRPTSSSALPGSEAIAKTIGATFGHFRTAFGGAEAARAPQRVTAKCLACGAPVTGMSGTVAKCPYCDSATKLE